MRSSWEMYCSQKALVSLLLFRIHHILNIIEGHLPYCLILVHPEICPESEISDLTLETIPYASFLYA